MSVGSLVLLRHGESEWNAKNLFTGWVDVPLSEQGEHEALRGGALLREAGLLPDVLHTSLLRRAINTANLALDVADRHWIPVHRHWRLNERHYGALQGKDKAQIREEYGEDQFTRWRRSYATPPPPIEPGSAYSQDTDPRYAGIDVPRAECLADVVARMLPYWTSAIVPDLLAGRTVLVAAHGNSLRALVQYLDGLDEQTVVGLNIPTGIPLCYEFGPAGSGPAGSGPAGSGPAGSGPGDRLRPSIPGGTYLDPEAAANSIAAVANQGR